MHGLMMDTQLLISMILRHAEIHHPSREIVSVTADDPLHRYTYTDFARRARKLANALDKMGLQHGDRVATLAWNDYRHLETYYGVGGAGYVCHTVNPRLFPEQVVFIINHAEDKRVFTDPMFVPLLEKIAAQTPGVEGYVVMTNDENMPETALKNVISYESLIADESETKRSRCDIGWIEALEVRSPDVSEFPTDIVFSHGIYLHKNWLGPSDFRDLFQFTGISLE